MKSVVFIVYWSLLWFCQCVERGTSDPQAVCGSAGCTVCNGVTRDCIDPLLKELYAQQDGSCAGPTQAHHTDSCNGPLQHNFTNCQPRNISWMPEITAHFRHSPDNLNGVAHMELQWTSDLDTPQSYQLELYYDSGEHICTAHVAKNVSKFIHHPIRYLKGTADNWLYIKLIPEGWCDGFSQRIPTPHDCYNTCPGRCACRTGPTNAGPKNMTISSACQRQSVHSLHIDWDYGEKYYAPHPANTSKFTAVIYNNSNNKQLIGVAVISNETFVDLEVEGLEPSNIYRLEMSEFICGDKLRAKNSLLFLVESCATFPTVPDHTPTTSLPDPTPSSSTQTSLPDPTPSSSAENPTNSPYSTSSKISSPPPPTTSPPEPKSTRFLVILTPILVVLSLVILILAAVLITCSLSRMCRTPPPHAVENKFYSRVLVLFSQASPRHEEECIMENVVKMLAEYNIESVVFDRPCVRGSIAEWVFRNVESCSKVLLVCNKQFAEEWKKGIAEDPVSSCSVIYVLHQIIDSYVKHDKAVLDKFAILYLKKKDCSLIDNPYLRNMTSFLVDPHDVKQSQQLVRFITDTPTYAVLVLIPPIIMDTPTYKQPPFHQSSPVLH